VLVLGGAYAVMLNCNSKSSVQHRIKLSVQVVRLFRRRHYGAPDKILSTTVSIYGAYVECYYRYINIKTKENNSNTTIIIIAYGIIFGKMVSHL
jgi:hypothetical protein